MMLLDSVRTSAENGGAALTFLNTIAQRTTPAVPIKHVRGPGESAAGVGRSPKFSVVIPCYNYAVFLPFAVRSALTQGGVDVEVVIVDDASTDNSAQEAARLAIEHPQVRVVTNPTNSGHVVTFNNGFRVATGDFIVRLDADDLLTPGSLARSAALFAAFPSVGLVYGRPRHFAGDWPPAPVVGEIGWTVWSGQDWIAERCRRAVNCITTPEAAVRASVMRDVGGLDTSLKFAQDMEMWLRVAAVSDVGWIKGADQALHREHPASMSVTAGAGSLTDLRERRAVFQVLFQRMGGHISYAAELRDTALRGLAREALGEACQAYNRGAVRVTPVEELIVFAQQTWPKYEQLPEFRALQRRRRVGAAVSPFVPGFFAAAVKRRVASELGYARWLASGV